MTANKPMTGEQLDELMTAAVNMQRDAETDCNRPSAMFAYAVQVAVLELRKVRDDSAALAAENAGLKQFPDQIVGFIGKLGSSEIGSETKEKIEAAAKKIKTPATNTFLDEVRAQGVEAAIATAKNVVAQEFQYKDFETAQRVCSKFPESDLVGKVEMVEWLEDFADQLRKGVQS
ncbi:eae-like domain protein [Enterobacter bugandensis]|uniref:eae-like domain protein n=1 Tax=Enterobacter bugandensis TaxID=881260 RepID=UPI00244804F1|nr:eae-like domain protein [Enterobacter bugandensis]MDH0087786.1 eae-like domain protein [Enterobacter bugandensis]MDH0108867.1 eae-like domain protein [Enterobacter bugandensis]MDH0129636.1 eae-like domain protein [Enterobacter bugandensis]